MQTTIQKITPFLWFDTQAEEAAQFYTEIFPDSAITATTPPRRLMGAMLAMKKLDIAALRRAKEQP